MKITLTSQMGNYQELVSSDVLMSINTVGIPKHTEKSRVGFSALKPYTRNNQKIKYDNVGMSST